MAIAFETIQTATSGSPGLTLTKPTGLTVGDLLVAGLTISGDANPVITAPAGWTTTNTKTLDNGDARTSIFQKVAESSDVAASDFSFTATANTTGATVAGFMTRISGFGIQSGFVTASGSGTTLSTGAMTPTRINNLMLIITASASNGDLTPPTSSGYQIVTNNPTWTERADVGIGSGSYMATIAVATASRPEITSTGAASFTLSESKSLSISLLSLGSVVSGSITPETKVNIYALNPIPKTGLDIIVTEPDEVISNPTLWKNQSKPTTNWNNLPK